MLEQAEQVISFKKLKPVINRIYDQKLHTTRINDKANQVQCLRNDDEPTMVHAEFALSQQSCSAYFEVEIIGLTDEDTINVGLVAKDNNIRQYLGKSMNSIGIIKHEIFMNKKKISNPNSISKMKLLDRIGCGINFHQKTFFFTQNGTVVVHDIEISTGWDDFYPAVALSTEKDAVRFIFNYTDCAFKVADFDAEIQLNIQNQIAEQSSETSAVYSLVHEYLSFNGYTNTLEAIKAKNITYSPISQLTKNHFIRPSICFHNNQALSIDPFTLVDQDITFKMRNRIRSEIILDQNMDFQEVRRKNTEMGGEIEQSQHHRKESLFSNISNISLIDDESENQGKPFEKEEQKEMKAQWTPEEQFLLHERKEIIGLIRAQKIEEAAKILRNTIPKIFEHEEMLDIYLKAHIFLSKIITQGSANAIKYAKQEKGFQTYKNNLFPFFNLNQNLIEWSSLKNVFKYLTFGFKKDFKAEITVQLTITGQFQHFSILVNQIILKEMGYVTDSRLGVLMHHTQKMLDRLNDFRGMNCGIQLRL